MQERDRRAITIALAELFRVKPEVEVILAEMEHSLQRAKELANLPDTDSKKLAYVQFYRGEMCKVVSRQKGDIPLSNKIGCLHCFIGDLIGKIASGARKSFRLPLGKKVRYWTWNSYVTIWLLPDLLRKRHPARDGTEGNCGFVSCLCGAGYCFGRDYVYCFARAGRQDGFGRVYRLKTLLETVGQSETTR